MLSMLINLTKSIYKVFLLCFILLTVGCETFTFREEEAPAPAEQAVPAEVTEKQVVDKESDARTVTETVDPIAPD